VARKDKIVSFSVTQTLQTLGYNVANWDDSKSKLTSEIEKVLSTASKSQTSKPGYPDRIYINKSEKLLILVEEKQAIKDHDNPDKAKGAISGIKWYMEQFLNSNLSDNLKNYFANWKILGIAVSGDLLKEYYHKFSLFFLDYKLQRIILLPQITNFVTEKEFLAIFNNLDEEKAVTQVSQSSKKINNLLRSVDSQKRPILLSALMISLHKSKDNNFPTNYKNMSAEEISSNLLGATKKVLENEDLPEEKIKVIDTELGFLQNDLVLRKENILKKILVELSASIIPLFESDFSTNSNYDIIGKFYEEFLKYAGISNVKKGIILTPRHITTLFTKLIPLKNNDKIVDIACGTGAFLIAGMNALIDKIDKSDRSDKNSAKSNIKKNQLLGFEINTTMFICSISNMLFRGDGKSSIYNLDSINSEEAKKKLKSFGATIGFINPPYSGKENTTDPTPKEITFLTTMLDNCSRYGVIIAPLSTYFKETEIRKSILEKHTLKCVINMPADLFQPNASTNTAIAVFETNRKFEENKDEVVFYDLQDDGFQLSKHKGRTDVYNKWENIEKKLLDAVVYKKTNPDNIKLVKTKIKKGDEWTIHAHSKTDYSTLSEDDFVQSVFDYAIFQAKRDLGILKTNLTEIEVFETIGNYFSGNKGISILTKNNKGENKLYTSNWKEFSTADLFDVDGTKTTPLFELETTYGEGDYPYITTRATNNSVAGFYDYKTEKGNVLIIDSAVLGFASYQENDFSASDHVELLKPRFNMNKYIALFIKTIFMKGAYKYAYGRKFNQERIKNTKLLLPVDKNNNPDWQYMENYIKSLPYADLL
jgi:hypothetical protein